MNIKIVNISDCYHFRGFRYGGFGNNIYEDYIIGLFGGADVSFLRRQLLGRILSFDGLDFGAVLGLQLERKYRPWVYPWDFGCLKKYSVRPGLAAESNPDVICHVSSDGVLASHVNREFFWLERAYHAMKVEYDPGAHGYIKLLPLIKNGVRRYIVLDGNHRISAMHALGYQNISAHVVSAGIRISTLARFWPGVMFKIFELEDAQAIFNRYFYDENLPFSGKIVQKIICDEPILIGDEEEGG